MNNEVYYLNSDFVTLNKKEITELEQNASKNIRKRARICTHKDSSDILQEMFIVHYAETYVRPHFHKNKIESFHVISGEADVIVFNKDGSILEVVELGEYNSGKNFYYRINPNIIHCLLIKSEIFVFHESTLGPFDPADSGFPEWAPDGTDQLKSKIFMEKLNVTTIKNN